MVTPRSFVGEVLAAVSMERSVPIDAQLDDACARSTTPARRRRPRSRPRASTWSSSPSPRGLQSTGSPFTQMPFMERSSRTRSSPSGVARPRRAAVTRSGRRAGCPPSGCGRSATSPWKSSMTRVRPSANIARYFRAARSTRARRRAIAGLAAGRTTAIFRSVGCSKRRHDGSRCRRNWGSSNRLGRLERDREVSTLDKRTDRRRQRSLPRGGDRPDSVLIRPSGGAADTTAHTA